MVLSFSAYGRQLNLNQVDILELRFHYSGPDSSSLKFLECRDMHDKPLNIRNYY